MFMYHTILNVIINIFGYLIYTDMTGTVVYVLQETCP